jgi:hypothetical protein
MSPLPARMTPSDSEAALAMKFLEVCQELTIKGIHFTCTLTIGSTINLSLDTTEKEKKEESTTPLARKKTSPSTTRRNARRKALYLNKKEEEKQTVEKSKVPENTTTAAEASYKEIGNDDSRRITTILKKKSLAQVEKPPEQLPQLDGEEDGTDNDEDEDVEGIDNVVENQSDKVSELELVKGALDTYIKNLDPETLRNQPHKEISDLKVAVSNIIRKHLKC